MWATLTAMACVSFPLFCLIEQRRGAAAPVPFDLRSVSTSTPFPFGFAVFRPQAGARP
jgi:hypothetical protein